MSVSPWHLRQAARAVHHGGIVAYPTEAVYGLGCDPADETAVEGILALKHRPVARGLILIAAEPAQLEPWIAPLDAGMRRRVEDTWPGPVTWLVPTRSDTPAWLCGRHETIAVRVTAHAPARALCESADSALVSTSANPTGRHPARDTLDVRRYFGDALDYILPGECGGLPGPTEIRDARTGEVIRPSP